MFNRSVIPFLVLSLVPGCMGTRVNPKEADAVAEIKRLGGKFTVDEKSPETPVIDVDSEPYHPD